MTTTALKNRYALGHTTVSTVLTHTWATVALWRQRARQRVRLAEMPPEMLQDIGVSASAARVEAGKPFWAA
ncbi:MAG: DUF1127 domain-containing protein [Gammaproteobacteria bacterium]|nr:DUF1127 domain-containing protein [Gammaproteobacteria bacterium]